MLSAVSSCYPVRDSRFPINGLIAIRLYSICCVCMCVSCLSFIASHTWKNYSERSSVHHLLKTCEDYKRSCLLSVRTCLLVPGMHACQGRLQTVMKIKDLISIVGLRSPFWHIHHNKTKPYTYLLQSVVFTEPCLPWLWLFMLIWICLINCFWLYPSDDISSWQHPLCLMEDEGGILRRGATPLTNCNRFLKINKTIAGIDKTHSFFFFFLREPWKGHKYKGKWFPSESMALQSSNSSSSVVCCITFTYCSCYSMMKIHATKYWIFIKGTLFAWNSKSIHIYIHEIHIPKVYFSVE